MRRLRRSIGIGAALSFLLLGAPVDAAGADTPLQDPPAPQAEQASARRPVAEPTGRAASVSAMRSGKLRCGDMITQTTTLTADVGPCSGTAGIIIGVDNIMLNLNGHTVFGVSGPGSGNDGGIRLPNRTGVTITGQPGSSGRMGTVTGFDAGVVVNGGSANTIVNLHVRDNIGFEEDPEEWWAPPSAELGDGIIIFKSTSNRIVNNLVTNNGRYDGIGVFGLGSDFNTIQGNTVQGTAGIFGNTSAGGSGIIVNHFLDQRPGTGGVISGNKVIGNTSQANLGSGISSVGSVNGQIVANVAEDNGLEYAFAATWEYVAESYPANGIGLQGAVASAGDGATNMLVKDNIVNRNGLNGIFLDWSAGGNLVETNQVFDNGAFGVFTRNSFDVAPNRITSNDTGHNYILDLFDSIGRNWYEGMRCPNVWFGNTWGPPQPGAKEYFMYGGEVDNAYAPDCTAAGGSGPNPPAEG